MMNLSIFLLVLKFKKIKKKLTEEVKYCVQHHGIGR